jgi:hypothetical protein
VNVYATNPLNPDTDGDGLNDSTEINGCTDVFSPDSDADGIGDAVEYQQGTSCNTGPVLPGLTEDDPVTDSSQWTPVEHDFGGVLMLLVPVGSYRKGTPPDAIDGLIQQCQSYLTYNDCRGLFGDEGPDFTTGFRQPFWIDRYEVTNDQFARYGGSASAPSDWPDPQQPRSNITWQEAQKFCEARDARLPTEAGWSTTAMLPASTKAGAITLLMMVTPFPRQSAAILMALPGWGPQTWPGISGSGPARFTHPTRARATRT